MPGPQIIRIKRKREDAPLETLLVDPPKRPRRAATSPGVVFLFKRLAPEAPALAPPAPPAAALLRGGPGRARDDVHMTDAEGEEESQTAAAPALTPSGVPAVATSRAGDKARDPLALMLKTPTTTTTTTTTVLPRQEPVPGTSKKRSWGNGASGKAADWKRRGVAGSDGGPPRPEVVLTRAAAGGKFEVVRGPDAMEVDGEEWVLDTFVRDESAVAPPAVVDAAGSTAKSGQGELGATATATVPEGTQRVPWLWDGDEWWDDEEEGDSDKVDTDDEDSNAEDYYGADYPEDEDDDEDFYGSDREDGGEDGDDDYRDRYVADYDDHVRAVSYR